MSGPEVSAALRDALARALSGETDPKYWDELDEWYTSPNTMADGLVADMRSDPEVLQAVAEALRSSGGLDEKVNEWTVAVRLLDHLLGSTQPVEPYDADHDAIGPRGCRRYFSGDRTLCKTHSDLRDCLGSTQP